MHALPLAAALREAHPGARIGWLVDARHQPVLDLVPVISERIPVDTRAWRGPAGLRAALARLRRDRFGVAFDAQGLLKSAVLARLSGARRVVGLARPFLRERAAALFYSETVDPGGDDHVVARALALAGAVGLRPDAPAFPLAVPDSAAPAAARAALDLGARDPFVILNPGAAWPNKRWPPDRFGAVAAAMARRRGLRSAVLWGPGEAELASAVVAASAGAAAAAPPTTLGDLVALLAAARLVVSGDTGPLHLAAALGTPVVGIYGPTRAARNGPWAPADLVISRSARCQCHHQRRCHAAVWCLDDVSVEEVAAAVDRRLDTPRHSDP